MQQRIGAQKKDCSKVEGLQQWEKETDGGALRGQEATHSDAPTEREYERCCELHMEGHNASDS